MIIRNIILTIIAAIFIYGAVTSSSTAGVVLMVAAVVVISTGAILNKLDKIERYLKEQKSEEQEKTEE